MNSTQRIRLWDGPLRVFHWLLVLAVIGAIVTGQVGGNWIEWHGKLGLFIVGLLAFRVVWGFIGSTYARFAQFFPTPSGIRAYLQGRWQGLGHNPLGALSVFGLLGLLTAQVSTGLVANDDIAFTGPLIDLVGRDFSSLATGWHKLLSNGLIALIVLHIAAIAFYGHVKKERLVGPMIVGWKDVSVGESARGGGWAALIVALLIALAAVYGASGLWLPEPPPPPPAQPVTTPSW